MELREWRKLNGATLEQLSKLTGIPVINISRYERGMMPKIILELWKLQEFTMGNVTLEDFAKTCERQNQKKNKAGKENQKERPENDLGE